MKETEVAAQVVEYLESDEWDLYQEVDDIDIVGKRGRLLCAVECKTALTWKVCEQALDRRGLVHWVWVAHPVHRAKGHRRGTWNRPSTYAQHCLERDGIGLLWLYVDGERMHIEQAHPPKFNRRVPDYLHRRLRPEQKRSSAGSPAGGNVWSPFRDTCERLRRLLDRSGDGILVKSAIEQLQHHYASDTSAYAALVEWTRRGSVGGVELRKENGRLFFVKGT